MTPTLLAAALLTLLDFNGIDGPAARPLDFDDPAPRSVRDALYLRTPEADPVADARRAAWMRDVDRRAVTAAIAPTTPPAAWTRVDSRGGMWSHADRATLDAHVDAVERSYAGQYGAPAYGSACVGGQCGGVPYATQARRSGFRIFGRR